MVGRNETTIGRKRALASEQATMMAIIGCPVADSSTITSWPGKPQINSEAAIAISMSNPVLRAKEPNPIMVKNRMKAGRLNESFNALRMTACGSEIIVTCCLQ